MFGYLLIGFIVILVTVIIPGYSEVKNLIKNSDWFEIFIYGCVFIGVIIMWPYILFKTINEIIERNK